MHPIHRLSFSRIWLFYPVAFCLILEVLLLTSCQRGGTPTPNAVADATRSSPRSSPSSLTPSPTSSSRRIVLFLGDSLTAGFRLTPSEAYPSLISEHWKTQKLPWRARNAGVSGDTTAGVIRRLDWVLTEDVHTVFLAIGANDGLRGQSLVHIEKNLRTIITQIQKKGISVILAGIKLPRNYGKSYYQEFEEMYPKLAHHFKIPLLPFLLENVAAIKHLNLPDGIHPNTQGHQIIARQVLHFFAQQKLFVTSSSPAHKGKP